MYCTECHTEKAHNGLCPTCYRQLRSEYDEQTDQLATAAHPLWHDARARAIVRAQLSDYDNPETLAWGDREVAKLLAHNYDARSWA